MDRKETLRDVIDSFSNYYEKQESFKKVFMYEPVMVKAIEVFDAEMFSMLNHILDLIGVPDEGYSDKYQKVNWTRDVCCNLIKMAVKDEKYVEPTIELVSDWENLNQYTSKVESHTWFHYQQLLDEHITGYKNWYEKQRKEESKAKGKK